MRVLRIPGDGRLLVGDPVAHDRVDHAEAFPRHRLERLVVAHAPRTALVVVPAEPALRAHEGVAAEDEEVLELPVAGPGGGCRVDRGAAPAVGRREAAVAGQPVVAVEGRYVDRGREGGGLRPDAGHGGERQRAAIARALYNSPDIILADEPTASLDTERAKRVVHLLKEVTQKFNKSVVMITHDTRLLNEVDKVYEMQDGVLTQVR